ncbi:unnamed protein product, partial [Iphiclides podalirius]
MLLKGCFWIILWIINTNALVVEDLITGKALGSSSKPNYNVYSFVDGDTLDILCRRDEPSVGNMSWIINTVKHGKLECENSYAESIRYRVSLQTLDNKKEVICLATSPDGSEEKFHILLNNTGTDISEDIETVRQCMIPTDLVCPDSLNPVFMNISVNGNILTPKYDSYSTSHEYIYKYNETENFVVTCNASDSSSTPYIIMCKDAYSKQEFQPCLGKNCAITKSMGLDEVKKYPKVYCFTLNENEALTKVKFISVNDDTTRMVTTVYPPTETTAPTEETVTEQTTEKDLVCPNPPHIPDITEFGIEDIYFVASGVLILLTIIAIVFLIFTIYRRFKKASNENVAGNSSSETGVQRSFLAKVQSFKMLFKVGAPKAVQKLEEKFPRRRKGEKKAYSTLDEDL